MVREHSTAGRQLVFNFVIVMVREHCFFDVWMGFIRYLIVRVVFVKEWSLLSLGHCLNLPFRFQVHESPIGETRLEFEARKTCIDESYLALVFFQGSSNHSFIFNWVQRTGWIGNQTTDFEQFNSTPKDLKLKWMQWLSVFCVPVSPFLGDLTDGSIWTTGHVAKYSIVSYSHIFTSFKVHVLQLREELSLVIGDDNVTSVQSIHLMRQHKRAFGIRIIRHYKSWWDFSVWSTQCVHVIRLN